MTKLLLIASLFLMPIVAGAQRQDGEDKWWVGTGETNGQWTVVRALGELPSSQIRIAHPWGVKVIWVYSHASDGKISTDEAAREFDFERALESRMENQGFALEALSVTHGGVHEWTYYASEKDKAVERFESVKQEFPGASISIEIHRDAEWNVLRDVLRAAGK